MDFFHVGVIIGICAAIGAGFLLFHTIQLRDKLIHTIIADREAELAKEEAQAKTDCHLQGFYNNNFELCLDVGVHPDNMTGVKK